MELGQRLRQARLEAGLSQRQLCGEEITRNMLSQIENGGARPSMQTLQYLAGRLGKPISWFLEEGVSVNAPALEQARLAYGRGEFRESLERLKECNTQDSADQERYLLEVLCRLSLAREVLDQGRKEYAKTLLEETAQMGRHTIYYSPELERLRLSLCYRADPSQAAQLAKKLPDDYWERLLRGHGALLAQQPERCLQELAGISEDGQHRLLQAKAFIMLKQYEKAVVHLEAIHREDPKQALPLLELCFRELGDYQKAYYYACLQRDSITD